jgi:hypothetical protein
VAFVLLTLHVPPAVALVRLIEEPTVTKDGPVIVPAVVGVAIIFINAVRLQEPTV